METIKQTTCFFTGHRNIPSEIRSALSSRIDSAIECMVADGYDTFVCGGAVGFDTLAACRVIAAKKRHPGIRLVLVLPCRDQTARWKNSYDIDLYRKIKGFADEVLYVSEVYTPKCMHLRNRVMADISSHCIAYCREKRGGTAYTVKYAKQCGVSVTNLAPEAEEQIKITE